VKKVAIFGNAGGGKSTLSNRLSEITDLPVYILDKIQFLSGGIEVPQAEYQRIHQEILATDRWIIDGFGCMETLWPRLNEADTLIYIDLPLSVHFWLVTKRAIAGHFKPPAGWPERSPILKSSISSYRALWLCHKSLTPKYREYVDRVQSQKRVYHLTSTQEISQFLASIERESNSSLTR
jgi:adenylate kinase family enzyme